MFGLELVDQLVEPRDVDPGLESTRVRLDDESRATSALAFLRGQTAAQDGIQRGLEGEPLPASELLEARRDIGLERDGRAHQSIMMLSSSGVKMRVVSVARQLVLHGP
jgi:hypothetical protein